MNFEIYRKEMEALKASLETCARRGFGREEILVESIGRLVEFYEYNPEQEYLVGALIHIRTYLELGFSYDRYEALFDSIIRKTGKSRYEVFPDRIYSHTVVRLNKSQVRNMLRRWSPSRQNEMSIKEVVEDICEKVSARQPGVHHYINHSPSNVNGDDIYELVINEKECYFHDLKFDRYYTFK